MQSTPLRQQLYNYSSLFKNLFFDYYSQQKKNFWWIQFLIIVSTLSGVFWISGVIVGISHYQSPLADTGIKNILFTWMYNLPIWQWLLIVSISGLLSAWMLYLSISLGVHSSLSYQKHISRKAMNIASAYDENNWYGLFSSHPRQILLRILRQGIQMSGLLCRRMGRAFIDLIIFLVSIVFLWYLDKTLLLILLPVSLVYLIALYFINRYAARISTEMADIQNLSFIKFNKLVSEVLDKKVNVDSLQFEKSFDDSLYMKQASLKYQRRLAEIHVNWMNTVILVLSIALLAIYFIYVQSAEKIDWQHLLFFLLALKYAAASLQQLSATTVAFSRFMPEVDLLYRLLRISNNGLPQPINVKVIDPAIIFLETGTMSRFELDILSNMTQMPIQDIYTLESLKNNGLIGQLKKLSGLQNPFIITDNKLIRLQKFADSHSDRLDKFVGSYLVVNLYNQTVTKYDKQQFLNYSGEDNYPDSEDDLDALL